MLQLGVLLKVLFKPREAFESLKDYTNAKDGIIIWFLMTLFALFIFGGITRNMGMNIIIVPFGVASIDLWGILIGVISSILFLAGAAGISNLIAQKVFKGQGTFSEVFGMFGYSGILLILRSISSVAFVIIFFLKTAWIAQTTVTGGTILASNIIGSWMYAIIGIMIIFNIWMFLIRGAAVSVSHGISFLKGIICSMLSIFIITIIVGLLSNMLAYSLYMI